MANLSFIVIVFSAIQGFNSQWISPATKMPVDNSLMNVGYYQNTIYMIGGWPEIHGLLKYHLSNDTFSFSPDFLLRPLYSLSQWWFQINDVLYMTGDYSEDMINTYNLRTNTFTSNVSRVPEYHAEIQHCLTGDPNQSLIFYLGGTKTVQILNLTDMIWNFAPNMTTRRAELSCIVSPNNKLYAIGGAIGKFQNKVRLDSIEFISTININLGTWSYTQQNLTQPLSSTGCVVNSNNIFIIGGKFNDTVYTDKVHIINTNTNEVSVADDRLVYSLAGLAPIIFDNRIYVFGGFGDSNIFFQYTDRWQYIQLSNILPQEQSQTPSQNSNILPQTPTTGHPTTSNPTTKYPTTTPTTIPKEGKIIDRFTSTVLQTDEEYVDNSALIIVVFASVIFLCWIAIIFIVWRKKREVNVKNVINADMDVNAKKEKNVEQDTNVKSEQITKRYIVEDSLSDDDEMHDNQQMTTKTANDIKDNHDIRPEGMLMNGRYDDNKHENDVVATGTTNGNVQDVGDV